MYKTLLLLLLLCGFVACSENNYNNRVKSLKEWMVANGKVKVFSTIAMIDDLVSQVGGIYVDTAVLIKGELDPHSYQLVKGDDEKLAFADIIFYNGLGLEHGAGLQSYLKASKKAISLGDRLNENHPKVILYHNGQLDPHIWMDVDLWAKVVPYIVDALVEKDPNHAEQYRLNGEHLIEKMSIVSQEIRQELQAVPENQRYLVTSHDAFNYFTRAYLALPQEDATIWQSRFIAPEGLAPESQISSIDIRNLIKHIKKHHIHVIFPESNINRDSIRKIIAAAKEQGIDVSISNVHLYADAMGPAGTDGDSYLKMMRYNSKIISSQLLEHP